MGSNYATVHILEKSPQIEVKIFDGKDRSRPSIVITSEDEKIRAIVTFMGDYESIRAFSEAMRQVADNVLSLAKSND